MTVMNEEINQLITDLEELAEADARRVKESTLENNEYARGLYTGYGSAFLLVAKWLRGIRACQP